ncbi:MAG: Gfo/Idh/MocA family oxidoreductase, partial [Planctomycetota bacterium]
MALNSNRRTFIRHAAIAGAALPGALPTLVRAASPNSKLNLGAIAVGGKGWTDVNQATPGHNLVAFCDVMTQSNKRKGGYGAAAEQWPKARRYQDWRRLLDEGKDIDALTISTPDHMHAAPTLAAMRLGKHVYTQKPLTHTIQEARLVRDEARRLGVKTQMGIQNQSKIGHRMTGELIKSGVIGKVTEAHSWSHKEWAGPAEGRRPQADPIPKGLDWDLWLGNAPVRPYNAGYYAPSQWRGWIDFGSGTLGDMGIHIYEPLHTCLDVGPARTVKSLLKAPNPETWQPRNIIEYTFDGTPYTKGDTIKYTWYDGNGNQPDRAIAK